MVRQKCKVHKSGSAKCIIQFCKMEDSIENAATTTNQPLSHQLSLENRRVSDRLRRQGESDEQRLGARRASRRLESHDQRLQNRRVSDRLRRDQESQEEHDQRLQRRRERDVLARQEESQEQHEQRLERNMDIQMVGSEYGAAMYVCMYVSKSEPERLKYMTSCKTYHQMLQSIQVSDHGTKLLILCSVSFQHCCIKPQLPILFTLLIPHALR